ncbi:MAG TPA: zinc ribbon domain-containing protein [Pyrinomonadaceae bacterium]|nr:zinc ribbon domain-containing protein [Pyrinomonadaceae bacterium]
MPIYEYKCKQCGTVYEKRQNVSDAPLTNCEKCHGELEKQWSLSGFQFKGGGWYVTDYAGGSKKTEKSTAGESTSSTDAASKPVSDSGSASTAKEAKPAKNKE